MKIEIDLNDILGDENGAESLQDSVRRQVIDNVSSVIKSGIKKKVDEEVAALIGDEVRKTIADKLPPIVDDLLSTEYTPVDSYGRAGNPTNMRSAIIDAITKEMVYKKTSYSSDRNLFTRTVDECIQENLKQFQVSFNTVVNEALNKEMLAHAVAVLKQKLNM